MANTYEWIFDPIEVKQHGNLDDVVCVVHWRCNAESDDGFTASIYGSAVLNEPNAAEFIDFNSENFSKDLVKSWIIPCIGDNCTEDAVFQVLDGELEKQRTPPTVQKKPASW